MCCRGCAPSARRRLRLRAARGRVEADRSGAAPRDDGPGRYRDALGALKVAEAAEPRLSETAARLGLEPVDELAIARAAHLGQAADAAEQSRDGAVISPPVPGLEVDADRERRAVAVVALEERVPERQERLVLDRGDGHAGLVRE